MLTASRAAELSKKTVKEVEEDWRNRAYEFRDHLRSLPEYDEGLSGEVDSVDLERKIRKAASVGRKFLHMVVAPGRPPTKAMAARALGRATRDASFLRQHGYEAIVGHPYESHDHHGKHSACVPVEVRW